MRTMNAKYASECRCGTHINRNDRIGYFAGMYGRKGIAVCTKCADDQARHERADMDDMVTYYGGDMDRAGY